MFSFYINSGFIKESLAHFVYTSFNRFDVRHLVDLGNYNLLIIINQIDCKYYTGFSQIFLILVCILNSLHKQLLIRG